MIKHLPTLLTCTFSLPLMGLAQTETEIIVVTASQQQQRWLNAPASIEVRPIPSSGLLIDSGQLLAGIPGLQVDSRANFAQDTRLSIRGFGSRSAFGVRGIYLLQDNIPISSPDGQGQLSSVLLDNIQDIEVLRGPLAVLFGNGAGGVIALRSAFDAPSGLSSGVAFSQQHQQYQLALQHHAAKNQFSLAAKHFETDGFRPQSAARKQQLQALWQQQLNEQLHIRFRLDWSYDPLLQDPLSLTPQQWREDPRQTVTQASLFDTTKTTRQRQLSSQFIYEGLNPWQISLWQGQREVNQRLAFTGAAITSAGGDIALDRKYQGFNAQHQFRLSDSLTTTLGGSVVQSEDERQGYVNDFGVRGALRRDETNLATNQDVFIRFNYQPLSKLSFDGGVRYSELAYKIRDRFIQGANPDDSGNKTFYQYAVALGTNYQLNNNWSWFISSGQGFEAPTLAELAYRSEGTGLNLDLDASTNRQFETGVKYTLGKTRSSISLFEIQSRDEIVVASSNNGRTSFRNAGNTSRYGAEFFWQTAILPQLNQQLSLSYLRARFTDANLAGNPLPGVAKLNADWQLQWQPYMPMAWFVAINSHYRSRISVNDANTEQSPAVTRWDLSTYFTQQYSEVQLRYWFQIDNLTDRDNVGAVVVNQANGRSFEPAPGRHLSAGLNIRYLW